MEYKLAIGDWKKMIRSIIIAPVLYIILIAALSILSEFRIKPPAEIVIPFIIIFPATCIFLALRRTYAREIFILEEDKIVSPRYGTIYFKDISKYKISKFRSSETLIITMNSDIQFTLAPNNTFTSSAQRLYDEFKIIYLNELNNENNRRKTAGQIEIVEGKSMLAIYYNVFIIFLIGFFDIYFLYLFLTGKHISGKPEFLVKFLIANIILLVSISFLIGTRKKS